MQNDINIAAHQELLRQMRELNGGTAQISPVSQSEGLQARSRRRIPMSVPRQRLLVDDLPGFFLYWFREENVPRAIDAGYEFVERDEANLNPTSVAADSTTSGNTDLGSRVSMVTGTAASGQPQRAYLMKLRQEWRDEDQAELNKANMKVMEAIFGDEASQMIDSEGRIAEQGNLQYRDHPYSHERRALFNRPTRKANTRTKRGR